MKSKIGHLFIIVVIAIFSTVIHSCKTAFPNRGKLINCNGELVLPVMNPTQRSSFPGGENALMRFIANNMNLPKDKLKDNITVAFIVTKDGEICDFRVTSKSKEYLENEIIRIFNLMPKWNPAIDNGKIVDCYNLLKFKF